MDNNLLSAILSAVEKRVNHASFDTWFRPITKGTKEDSTILLQVPNVTFREWISNNYGDVLEESLEELDLRECQVSFVVDDGTDWASAGLLPASGSPRNGV